MSKKTLGREVKRGEIVRFRESLHTTTASELVNSDITLIEAYFDYLLERVEKMEQLLQDLVNGGIGISSIRRAQELLEEE